MQEKLGLLFGSAHELNHIIDTKLRARHPCFKRAVVEMVGESFDFYFHDVLECVRALYRDPEFACYLVFTPEQHFADEACTNRLYHDIYTGK